MRMISGTEDSGSSAQGILAAGGALCAVGAGLVAALGVPRNAAFFAGAIITPLLVMVPVAPLLTVTLFVGFVLAGMVEFFLRFEQAHWVVAGLFGVLLLRAALVLPTNSVRTSGWHMGMLLMLGGYCLALMLSMAANLPSLLQAIAGLKHYFLPLGMLGVIACVPMPGFWQRIWRAIPWLVILQFPVALWQTLFYVQEVHDAMGTRIPWDAVVGTFGGDPLGGGKSGALALFLCFGVAATAALLRAGQISRRLAWNAWAAAAGVMLLAEIKVVVILLPFALLLYHRGILLRSPLRTVLWLGATGVFIASLLTLYAFMHYRDAGQNITSPSQVVEYLARYEGSVAAQNVLTGEVSRIGALYLWWRHNPGADRMRDAVLGHGPAASKISATFGYGPAAKRYRFNLNTSSLSALLWDVGALGTAFFVGLLVCAAGAAFTAARLTVNDPAQHAVYESSGIAAALLIITLPYNLDAIETPAIQMLLAIAVGLAFQALRNSRPVRRPTPSPLPGGHASQNVASS
jgi:hypothetical protein